jgi:hypothetical protein
MMNTNCEDRNFTVFSMNFSLFFLLCVDVFILSFLFSNIIVCSLYSVMVTIVGRRQCMYNVINKQKSYISVIGILSYMFRSLEIILRLYGISEA